MSKVINSTVYLQRDNKGDAVQVLAGTELEGDYAWVAKTLQDHGTLEQLTEEIETPQGDFPQPLEGNDVEALKAENESLTREVEDLRSKLAAADNEAGNVGDDLDDKNVEQLKELAKEHDIEGANGMKRADLLDALRNQ